MSRLFDYVNFAQSAPLVVGGNLLEKKCVCVEGGVVLKSGDGVQIKIN